MPVLDRDALSESPLADLHLLAAELGVDGFRRLRRDDLVDAILARQAGEAVQAEEESEEGGEARDEATTRGRRRRRGGRSRRRAAEDDEEPARAEAEAEAEAEPAEPEVTGAVAAGPAAERSAEGTIELLGNGSAFLRLTPPDPTDDDIYVSAAQVRRCELVPGDRVAGPVRPPRRSERHPSLVRVETINGRPAEEVAEGTRWEDMPAEFPHERFALDRDLEAFARHAPFGRGSRVVVVGGARSGKSRILRALARDLAGVEDIELSVAIAGVRPEELPGWREDAAAPAAALSFLASPDAQAQAIEHTVEQARRVAARGAHAVVLVDTLAYLPAGTGRRILAAARRVPDGGSLTIVATAPEPLGGETTVVALAADGTVDPEHSGTLRADLLQ
jgi:transcription termination factor Rho